MSLTPVAMTIAGSDSSGGAGIQADLRMFSARGVYGTSAITALTAQNPHGVDALRGLDGSFVAAQMEAVFAALTVGAVKTGMLWSAEIVRAVADVLARRDEIPSVVDPVMIATSGAKLVSDEAIEVYRRALLPQCTLATPNLDEARVLSGRAAIGPDDRDDAAQELADTLGCAVLLKGGHLPGDPVDVLCEKGRLHHWQHPRLDGVNTHGSGCMLSAAIAAELAQGHPLVNAVETGLAAVHRALGTPRRVSPDLVLAGIEGARECP